MAPRATVGGARRRLSYPALLFISEAFKAKTAVAKLPTIRLHGLRHTHASLMLQQGTHPKVVSERLGHGSTAFTMETYMRTTEGLHGGGVDSAPAHRAKEETVNPMPSSPYRVSRLAAATVAALVGLCSAASARGRDHTPPAFGGLASATTCIPGPIGPGIESRYHLVWEAASDNKTPSPMIVYEIYQATVPGGEKFSQPTYTTKRGRLSFDTPALASAEPFYFVVRARDRAGNEDTNTIEREGVNLCV